jgi:hypothetical protein
MRLLPIFFLFISWSASGQELNNPNKLQPCPKDQNVRYHNCWGTHIFDSGNKYIGEFKENMRNGQGTYTFADGDKYVGEFEYGNFHGQGILFIKSTGSRLEGVWENDRFVRKAKVNLFNLNTNVITNTDRTDIEREHQQLAEERRRLEDEKRQLAEKRMDDDSIAVPDNRRRFALVIGNTNYSSLPKLQNSVNDARLITQSLRSAGFQVSTYENLDMGGMENAIRAFGERLNKTDVGLFYYAGHGVQVKGKNYLIPVKENIKKSFEVPSRAIDVDVVLATLENIKNDLNIVVLDACRSSFPDERGINRGLASVEAAKGTFIAFATAPGKGAQDGEIGTNSPYTKHLARLIGKKGLHLEQVFKEVRKAVVAETRGDQVPWENSSLMGDFYFQK